MRSTQRAPKACSRCSKKRIKCDKQIPCRACIIRGLESSCAREIAEVTRITAISRLQDTKPTYEELAAEVKRLRTELSSSIQHETPPDTSIARNAVAGFPFTLADTLEREIHSSCRAPESSTVLSGSDIILPSSVSSRAIIDHGSVWTAWIHCAVHLPTFCNEHSRFVERMGEDNLLGEDPSWLAIYLAFIAVSLMYMNDDEIIAAGLESDGASHLVRNWYDASIFFLHKADFIRRHDMRSLQAIAILLALVKRIGDFDLETSFLAVGLRTAQRLGMDREPPAVSEDPVQQELSRRVWWTLVICEWLQRPSRPTCIREAEFQVNLPTPRDDDRLDRQNLSSFNDACPHPIQYHNAMIRLAYEYHRFASRLPGVSGDASALEDFVLQADESLARIIDELPPHLTMLGHLDNQRAVQHLPWIPWQRETFVLALLFYRLTVNRVLQHQWLDCEMSSSRAGAVCLSSAKALITLVDNDSTSVVLRRCWATTSCLFSDVITLAIELRHAADDSADTSHAEDINKCLLFFDNVRDQNMLARRAKTVLEEFMRDQSPATRTAG